MKKNREDQNYLIQMWHKVDQLELEAHAQMIRKQKRQRVFNWGVALFVIVVSLGLILVKANFAVMILSQCLLMLLCWSWDFYHDQRGRRHYDRGTNHRINQKF
ncbi:hypothetical protein ACLJJ6_01305 [Pediococcus siamensis]|uniref:hypothetical protein n=1 Tax=Pediococcus siamensis TaxID=381829 RepID=UPI00399F46CF